VFSLKWVQIEPMNTQTRSDVLVIGAGLAGLAAARELQDAGFAVVVLEKSRGVGGRCATRRLEVNGARVDHGAQFFTVRSERLQALVMELEQKGIVQEWSRGFPKLTVRGLEARAAGHPRYVCKDGMSALAKAFVGDDEGLPLEIVQNALVGAVFPSNLGWSAVLENGEIYQARSLIVNTPAPQALALTRSSLETQTLQALERVQFNPCWALMIALETEPEIEWRGLEIEHDMLEWAALDSSKRAPDNQSTLVLHATPAWSQTHLEHSPETVAALMLEAAQALLGDWVKPIAMTAHRWRYAKPSVTHPEFFLEQGNLVFCGDWCTPSNTRIEAALESGWAAAKHVLEKLGAPVVEENTHLVL
jgi:predicted NAD/FAD-dependent oxidoreductase